MLPRQSLPFLLAGLALPLYTLTAAAEPHQYELDPEHTTISFMVDHLGYADTLGLFLEFDGTFTYDMETQELSDLSVTVQTASVESFNEARDNHVKNADFLNVETYPVMTFTGVSASPESETSGTVTGDLTLLGVTKPVTLDVTLNKAADYPFGHSRFTLGISATGTVKRSDCGMMYAVENGFVADDVRITIETEAMRVE